jgi:GT2 family glycosyltransferase
MAGGGLELEMRRLDIGICSYGKDPELLVKCLTAIKRFSVTDWRVFIIHNPSEGDRATQKFILGAASEKIIPVMSSINHGYCGAVNKLFNEAQTEYIAYLDNDAEVLTPGWDEALCGYLDRFHEIGIVFPNWGHCAIPRGAYHEVLWAAGYCWVLNRMAQRAVGYMDTEIGHHEEVDYCTRLKLEGYKLACAPEIQVAHHEASTRNPASQERISAGVVRWMNKWTAYFGGKSLNYHSPNVLRILDWNVHALHMEDYFKAKLPGLNDHPQEVTIDGAEYDLIQVPRPKGFYRSRII